MALADFLFAEVLPMVELWTLLLGFDVPLAIKEDNQATITIAKRGFSKKLRSIQKTQKINLGAVKEILDTENVSID